MSILSSLMVVCAVVPFLESAVRRRRGDQAPGPVPSAPRAPGPGRPVGLAGPRRPAVLAALIMAVAAPIDTVLLHDNKQVILIEQGQVGKANAQ